MRFHRSLKHSDRRWRRVEGSEEKRRTDRFIKAPNVEIQTTGKKKLDASFDMQFD